MSVYVVDASVAAKWFIGEPHKENALSLLDEANVLNVPDFFFVEMDNILLKWVRRSIVTPDEANTLRRGLRGYPIVIHGCLDHLDSAYNIASLLGLSIYDALYAALAVSLKAKLVTADKRLSDALKDAGFGKHMKWVEELG